LNIEFWRKGWEVRLMISSTIDFVCRNKAAALILLLLNIMLARRIVYKIEVRLNRFAREALGIGSGIRKNTIYKNMLNRLIRYVKLIINKDNRILNIIIDSSRLIIKQAGFKNPYSLYIYIFFQYINPVIGFLLVILVRKNFITAVLFGIFLFFACQNYVNTRKKDMVKKFEKHTYIIYKYLNNQISAGMRVADAIKSVYMIVTDKDIRSALVDLASRFELTNDIDACLLEFKQRFECEAAETLAVALKQGIETGNNSNIIARQEKKMFNRFIHQVKLETDMAKFRSFCAITMFCAIISIMVLIPLINDIKSSLSQILIN